MNEFALLGKIGPRPVAQVQGASVFQVGWQYLPALDPRPNEMRQSSRDRLYLEPSPAQRRSYVWQETVVCELETTTRAWDHARRRALDRLSEEAVQARADAVVGVRLRRGEHDWADRTIDYLVSGTAIRWRRDGGSRWPVLTDLSVQDYWRLLQAGHEPAGLIATTAVIFVSVSQQTRMRRLASIAQTQELEELGRGFQAARDTVRARLYGQVSAHNGTGAVGVRLSHTVREEELSLESSTRLVTNPGWNLGQFGTPKYTTGKLDVERKGWVITMHGAGTAIRQRDTDPVYPPETVMRYRGR